MTWRPLSTNEMLVTAVGCGRRMILAAESASKLSFKPLMPAQAAFLTAG
jgi:hypothetical protein